MDNYTDIRTLIGIEFDENTHWGQLTILELKLLLSLALGQLESAQELVESFLQYNDNTVDRGLFYRALSAALEVELDDDMEMADYQRNFSRMFGAQRMEQVLGAISGEVRFPGLEPVGIELMGLDRHQRLLQSYQKLHSWRAARASQA